jgi:hypothetical protein
MGNKEELPSLLINIQSTSGEEDIDLEELERTTQNLHDELNELDGIERVNFVTKEEEAPDGSKSGAEVVALGSLLATLATSAGSAPIPSLVNTLQSWLMRHEKRKITLEIGGDKLEVTGISDKEQQKLIDTWISNHTQRM